MALAEPPTRTDEAKPASEVVQGRHQWSVMVVYGLTDAEARATKSSPGYVQNLDAEHRLSIEGPGCLNCEEAWSESIARQPCPAPWYTMLSGPGTAVRK